MNNLERTRREKDLTQVQLAAAAQVGQGMISAYERGTVPSLPVAMRLAKALGVSIETLWPETELQKDSAA